MDRETLERKVSVRANEKVNEAICNFKLQCANAARTLAQATYSLPFSNYERRQIFKKFYSIMASDEDSAGWPNELWRNTEEATLKEVLDTMNAMQKMLVAKEVDPENENKPQI